MPRRNEPDLEDVPPELRQELDLVFADTAEEVIARALEPAASTPAEASSADQPTRVPEAPVAARDRQE